MPEDPSQWGHLVVKKLEDVLRDPQPSQMGLIDVAHCCGV